VQLEGKKAALQAKHAAAIVRLEAKHAMEIELMQKEICELQEKLEGYDASVVALQEKDARREDDSRKLLCSSVGFVYVNSSSTALHLFLCFILFDIEIAKSRRHLSPYTSSLDS
jgi:hypothetical protein